MSDPKTPNFSPDMPDEPTNFPAGPGDERLDTLLAAWHAQNADRARAGRDRLLAALAAPESAQVRPQPQRLHQRTRAVPTIPVRRHWIRRFLMNRYSPVAAALVAVFVVGAMLLPNPVPASAQQTTAVLAPDGGRLDALDADGNVLGPCALKHTDVQAEASGPLLRVNVRQTYANPFNDKIETVYTFPLSHRAAVDRMTMTIGSRVVVGEVKEREAARRIYEAARDAGRIASLLEQERPNIFTQSVANIEPKAEIVIEISYVELLDPREGEYSFVFPTVVGPRFIPGASGDWSGSERPAPGSPSALPANIEPRRGLVLTAPAAITLLPDSPASGVTAAWLQNVLNTAARPVRPDAAYQQPEVIVTFRASYPDGSAEFGSLRSDGVGEVAGRWFHVQLPGTGAASGAAAPGAAFSGPSDQVPDANRITPMPTRPDTRAGHDIAISVKIDTGGPGLTAIASPSHTITGSGAAGARLATVSLANSGEIPNKDFVLTWRTAGSGIQEGVFTHTGEHGNFFSIILEPPARVENDQIVPRELCFVLDTSGSMNGWPIEKSKELMTKAIAQMRPVDTFNVITFAGATDVLWPSPRPASSENIAEAQKFVSGQQGRGGTEMMKAIAAALEQPKARGAGPRPLRVVVFLTDAFVGNDHAIIDAIKANRGTTRVFSLGVGNSVNRYLIEGMARAGGGESEVVLLDQDADAAVARLTRRIQSPVLTDITLEFSGNLSVVDVLPADDRGHLPDLYDLRPLVITGRYTTPGAGTLTIRGVTGAGPFERSINVTLPPPSAGQGSDAIATLWARAKVDQVTAQDLKGLQEGAFPPSLKAEVVTLGETFQIMTPFTSFVAVDKLSVTVRGKPRLVHIPIELPAGTAWEGFFGGMDDRSGSADKDGELLGFGTLSEGLSSKGEAKAAEPSSALGRGAGGRSRVDTTLAVKPSKAMPDAKPAGPMPSVSAPPPNAGAPRRPTGEGRRVQAPGAPAPALTPAPASAAAPAAAPGAPAGGGEGGTGGASKSEPASTGTGSVSSNAKGSVPALRENRYQPKKREESKDARDQSGESAGVPVDFFNGGANSVPEVHSTIEVGRVVDGEFLGGDEAAQKSLVDLLTAAPITPTQRRLLGIAESLSVRDQLATGRVPAVQLVTAAAALDKADAIKAAGEAIAKVAPSEPGAAELVAISALFDAKDATAATRAKALRESSERRLADLFRAIKVRQTVDEGLLKHLPTLAPDPSAAATELAVVVLVSATDKVTLDAVGQAGLTADYVDAEHRLVLGRIKHADIEKLAELEAVRRIELDR
jgi:hypothetical protein